MPKQCKAKSKQSGVRCKKWAVPGFDVCHIHGGKTPTGMASKKFKNGRYSKHLPTRLTEKYQQSLTDPALLELRNEIALIDARLEDLIKRVHTGEAGAIWMQLRDLWREYLSEEARGNRALASQYKNKIDETLNEGIEDYVVWREIQTALEQRRKLVESERKRLVDMQQYITSQQALTLVAALIGIVKENVTDRTALQNISTAVNGLVAANVS